jgi:hypothetical protein
MLVKPSQKILVSLGGGRKEDESLSQLSIIRLDATIELLRQDPDLRVLVMGGYEKSWYPGYNDRFQMPGAVLSNTR